MASTVTFIPNQAGIAVIDQTPQMVAGMKHFAEQIADGVRSVAPVDDDADEHYIDMLEVEADIEDGRATGHVIAMKFTALFLEFGTGAPGPTPAFAPLRRGAEAAGFRVTGGAQG